MRKNDIRGGTREWSKNLWEHIKALFSGLDTRVTALEQGGGGGGGAVSGVKGNAESTYRTGNVNLTAANIGAKATQSAVSDPTASGTGLTFIDSISQDAQGVITPTKKTVQTATQSADGVMSSTDKTKLDGIAAGAEVNSITGVKGDAESSYRTGNVNLTPGNIGAPARTDLTSIIATGTTNATGATIATGTYFYLNGTLVQAKADIASGAMFTNGTNYEAVTAGGLNSLSAVSYISVSGGQQSGTIKLVRCGKIRQLVFDDAKLPSNAGSFTIPDFSSSDRPQVLTGATLYINPNKAMFIWIRPSGSIGQISATAGDIVNGTLTWIV